MEYYCCSIKTTQDEFWIIWFSNSTTGVLTDQGSNVLVFNSRTATEDFLSRKNTQLTYGETIFDFAMLEVAADHSYFDFEDFDQALSFYNFLQDIANSLGMDVLNGETIDSAYQKLFLGSNLPSVTPRGSEQFPVLTETEQKTLFSELKRLLHGFLSRRTWVT